MPEIHYQLPIAIPYKNIIMIFMYKGIALRIIMLFNLVGQLYSAGHEKSR
ncbi:hypothetical protein GPB15_001851 [Salmonella enterica]|nr:hypothetical protein [Salmonella enterica]